MSLAQVLPFLQQYAQQKLQQPPPDLGPQPDAPQPQLAPGVTLPPEPSPAPPAPQQTKAHKLLQILQGGLVGGLSGLAANAQTYAATGRNAGFGGGVGAGFTQSLPLQAQLGQQELKQKQAQTKLTESQSEMVQTPYGPLPATLAKMIFPALITTQGKQNVANTLVQGRQNVANTQAQSAQNVANINKRFIAVPNVGVLDTQKVNANGEPALIPDSAQGMEITQEHIDDYHLPQALLGQRMTATQLAQWERAQNQQEATVYGQNGPALVNKQTKQVTPLGQGNPGMGKPLEVADPDHPGQTLITTGAKGQGMAGKSSASVQVPKAAAIAEVPTKIGDQKVAFSTAIQHADLLRRAAKALDNGNAQTLSGLENAFANEFGSSGPITARAVADAYGDEVTKMLASGHLTDTSMGKTARTIDPNKQNYQQIDSVLKAYQALAQSKMDNLNKQKQNAVNQSQPNKGGVTASDLLKKYPPK